MTVAPRTLAPRPLDAPIGPPPTARDALRRLEAVRNFDDLVRWSHELRRSGLLGEDGFTLEVVRYWGRLWPGEVPPQAYSPDGRDVRLPSGEVVSYTGNWQYGQWRLQASAERAA